MKRIAKGAEVITRTYLEKKNLQNQSTIEKEPRILNPKSNSNEPIDDYQQPGPSGVISSVKLKKNNTNSKKKELLKNLLV